MTGSLLSLHDHGTDRAPGFLLPNCYREAHARASCPTAINLRPFVLLKVLHLDRLFIPIRCGIAESKQHNFVLMV